MTLEKKHGEKKLAIGGTLWNKSVDQKMVVWNPANIFPG